MYAFVYLLLSAQQSEKTKKSENLKFSRRFRNKQQPRMKSFYSL